MLRVAVPPLRGPRALPGVKALPHLSDGQRGRHVLFVGEEEKGEVEQARRVDYLV